MAIAPEQAVECIRARYEEAHVDRCEEQGCRLVLDDIGRHCVLKGEKLGTTGKVCDCLVFTAHGAGCLLAAVELKSKTVDAKDVREQLANGAALALSIAKETEAPNPWLLLLVLSERIQPSEFRTLTSKPVMVNGQKRFVRRERCGKHLKDILKAALAL
jgi:hypothetical protein